MNAVSYRYAARTARGESVRGAMQAADRDMVLATLRARAVFVTAIEREGPVRGAFARWSGVRTPARRARLAFFRSFATLIRAGVPMRRSLEVTIERTTDGALREALRSVAAEIEQGAELSAALRRRPAAFPPLVCAMVAAGEAGGILEDVLERLATFLERDADLRKKVRAALAYPTVVSCTALALVGFLLARIVPMFAQMFGAFHVDLPITTRVMLAVGALLARPVVWLGAGVAACALVATVIGARRTRTGALAFDRARFALPLIGPLVREATTARLARTLGTLLRAGIELLTAIEVVRPVTGSPLYAAALARLDTSIRAGEPLTASLAATRLIDPLALALVRAGEETGRLDEMLLTIAGYFEADVETAIATLGAVIEPVLIVVLGVVVGFIVFSVFIPLYTLIGSVSR
ncbi:MAG: type II secretion system F family protein [Vulcanimicrobiaceae bacterium]